MEKKTKLVACSSLLLSARCAKVIEEGKMVKKMWKEREQQQQDEELLLKYC